MWFRQNPLPPGEKLLLLGDANAFAYPESILYSTCWDDSPLIPLLQKSVRYNQDRTAIDEISNPGAIRQAMTQAGIRMILYNRAELKRFRSPGNYGYTHPEINDRLMTLLEQTGVIEPFSPKEWKEFSDYTKENISVWQVGVSTETKENGK